MWVHVGLQIHVGMFSFRLSFFLSILTFFFIPFLWLVLHSVTWQHWPSQLPCSTTVLTLGSLAPVPPNAWPQTPVGHCDVWDTPWLRDSKHAQTCSNRTPDDNYVPDSCPDKLPLSGQLLMFCDHVVSLWSTSSRNQLGHQHILTVTPLASSAIFVVERIHHSGTYHVWTFVFQLTSNNFRNRQCVIED